MLFFCFHSTFIVTIIFRFSFYFWWYKWSFFDLSETHQHKLNKHQHRTLMDYWVLLNQSTLKQTLWRLIKLNNAQWIHALVMVRTYFCLVMYFFLVLAMFLTYLILILFLVSFVGKKNCACDEIDAAISSIIKESAKLSMNKKVIGKLETSIIVEKGSSFNKSSKITNLWKKYGTFSSSPAHFQLRKQIFQRWAFCTWTKPIWATKIRKNILLWFFYNWSNSSSVKFTRKFDQLWI